MWGSFPAQKLLTQGDNYFSKVCRDLIVEKAHFKLNHQHKVDNEVSLSEGSQGYNYHQKC
jgi:hypothetical protein